MAPGSGLLALVAMFGALSPACADPNDAKDIAAVQDKTLAPPGAELTYELLSNQPVREPPNFERRYEVPLLAAEIVAFYERELPSRGWKFLGGNLNVEPIPMTWVKDNFEFRIYVHNGNPTDERRTLTVVISKQD